MTHPIPNFSHLKNALSLNSTDGLHGLPPQQGKGKHSAISYLELNDKDVYNSDF
jgi:hypothetical protein